MSSHGSRSKAGSLGDGQLAWFSGVAECLERCLVFRCGENGSVELLAPFSQIGFNVLGPDDGSAIGQFHVLFQIPAPRKGENDTSTPTLLPSPSVSETRWPFPSDGEKWTRISCMAAAKRIGFG
jgi:hypothetical protein